jgi:hypothetical protein
VWPACIIPDDDLEHSKDEILTVTCIKLTHIFSHVGITSK